MWTTVDVIVLWKKCWNNVVHTVDTNKYDSYLNCWQQMWQQAKCLIQIHWYSGYSVLLATLETIDCKFKTGIG